MRKEEPDGFITHQLYFEHLLKMDNETLGGVYRNLILNFMGEEECPLDGAAYVITDIMNGHIQRDVKSYTERCRINKENARKRWEKYIQHKNDDANATNNATASDHMQPHPNDATASDRMQLMQTDAYIVEDNVKENKINVKEDKPNVNVNLNVKEYKKEIKKDVCALQADAPAELMPYTFMLKDGTYHRISKGEYENLKEAFPNVNLDIEIKKMVLWCSDPANAQKRKTKKGIMKFIRSWLGRSGAPVVFQKPEQNEKKEKSRYDYDELEKALMGKV